MNHISRSQWYRQKIEDFLKGNETHFCLDLYSSEVRRIEKTYPQILVSVGPLTGTSKMDQRHSCIIRKKNA